MTQLKWILTALPGTFVLASASHGAMIMNVGNHVLLPNTPGQVVRLSVSGGGAVQGINLNIQIGAGATETFQPIAAPRFTSVDVVTGTIFGGNANPQTMPINWPQIVLARTTTVSGTVDASGLLATLVIDTTGYSTGTWSLNAASTLNGPSNFSGTPITITDGSITIIVPEPTAWLLALPTLTLLARRRR